MDNLNQLGKTLGKNKKQADIGLKRGAPIVPQIERVRDTMDFKIPFEMEFDVQKIGPILLSLTFLPPPQTGCCADCSCAVCEFFTRGVTETLYQVTYGYVPGTVKVFKNNVPITTFVETDASAGMVTVWAHNNEDIVICYVYNICL